MKKVFLFALLLSLPFSVFANGEKAEIDADSVTTASIVKDGDALIKALKSDGTWMVALLDDVSVKDDIVVEGEFQGKPYRKIALYTQDENRNVTNRFKLTASKLIVRSKHTRIQSGTFIGDVVVEAMDFELVDAKVIGNVYFKTDAQMKSFKKDESSEVTGKVEIMM
ncbi:hypothetical protein S1OALGB6SA_382 [Olavius algarvensis spirochete endosymbiont]|uniref:hypothetical protein n=1 Tax=Olavius algarvensis spirochete endosymbiont TaxID=260710 RepID=UPI000F1910F8|nr:hypothetical protein [Olavius algarvensis spirochete endosymbiont]VDA99314.1 hypothetical protein S1OALGB6SA_382 [Olavius algarvensis spirochete endosymbiont]